MVASAINSTVLKIVFNQKVDEKSATNLDNYYIGIGDSKVSDSSIKVLNSTNYEAELQEDEKTVVIKGATETDVIWKDKHTAAAATPLKVDANNVVVKNKKVTIQVRNVKDATGNVMSTQEETFKSVDTIAPKLYGTKVVKVNGINTTVIAEDNVTEMNVTEGEATFMFDEPVVLKVDDKEAQVYLDGKNITKVVNALKLENNGKVFTLQSGAGLEDLKVGDHSLKIVGVRDLADNTVSGDILEAVLRVVDPEDEDKEEEAPYVKEIIQIEEGKFVLSFNAKPDEDTIINVKDSEGNTVVTKLYKELTNDVVEFADEKIDYGNATNLRYTVEVTGKNGGKIEAANGSKKAEKYEKVHAFKLDLEAPIVDRTKVKTDKNGDPVLDDKGNNVIVPIEDKDFYNVDAATITVNFKDGPFGGKVIANSKLDDKNLVLKQKVGEETRTLSVKGDNAAVTITPTDNSTKANIELDIEAISKDNTDPDLANAAKAMLSKEDKLLSGEYELILPRGIVTDAEKADGKKLSDNELKTPFAGDMIKFEVVDGVEEGDVSVPQTAQGLIEYDKDLKAIVVEFDGKEIDPKTVKDTANYTIGGTKLSSKTKIEYEAKKDVDGKEIGAFARIFLEEDTIELDGNYTITIKNVATKSGAKMLPVTATVYELKDNTRPVLKSATIMGDNKIEVKFSESVEAVAGAEGNFEVLVNGVKFNVEDVKVSDKDNTLVTLTLKDTFDYDKYTVVVITQLDGNGDYFLTDLAGNRLKEKVEVKATIHETLKAVPRALKLEETVVEETVVEEAVVEETVVEEAVVEEAVVEE